LEASVPLAVSSIRIGIVGSMKHAAMRLLAPDEGPWVVRAARWIARASSLASLALLALFATSGGSAPSAFEWLLLAFFPIGTALGMILAWRFEILGGAVSATSLVLFYAVLSLDGSRPPAGPWFVVFASPALALLACGLATRVCASTRAG
jgi:hypothetical protein